ncbi:uncharacterized protein [Panulirus ornatus]|uniref:uncharacterized protein n=1 Tax=Panulirus ornatus TaxID=150431 RepID=UPI003A889E84
MNLLPAPSHQQITNDNYQACAPPADSVPTPPSKNSSSEAVMSRAWLTTISMVMMLAISVAVVGGRAVPVTLEKDAELDLRCILCPGSCPTCYLLDPSGTCRPIFGCQA